MKVCAQWGQIIYEFEFPYLSMFSTKHILLGFKKKFYFEIVNNIYSLLYKHFEHIVVYVCVVFLSPDACSIQKEFGSLAH